MSDMMRLAHGGWIPAIPLPFYVGRKFRCECGETRKTELSYREHYALAHILEKA